MGKFKIRGGNVDAMKHDGTTQGATDLALWVKNEGGQSTLYPKGTLDYDLDNPYVQIESPRPQKLVGPGWWIVKTEDGYFVAMNSMDFDIIYEPILPDGEEPPAFDWGEKYKEHADIKKTEL